MVVAGPTRHATGRPRPALPPLARPFIPSASLLPCRIALRCGRAVAAATVRRHVCPPSLRSASLRARKRFDMF